MSRADPRLALDFGPVCTVPSLVLEHCADHASQIAARYVDDLEARELLTIGATAWLARTAGLDEGDVVATFGGERGVVVAMRAMLDDWVAAQEPARVVAALTIAAKAVPHYVPATQAAHVTAGGVA